LAAVGAVVERLVGLLYRASDPEVGDGADGVDPHHVAGGPAAAVGVAGDGHVRHAALAVLAPRPWVDGRDVVAARRPGAGPDEAALLGDQLDGRGAGPAQHPPVGVAALVGDLDGEVDEIERGRGRVADDGVHPGAVPGHLVPGGADAGAAVAPEQARGDDGLVGRKV